MCNDAGSRPRGQGPPSVANEWAEFAPLLSPWALNLLNRTDIHGRYKSMRERRPDPNNGRLNPSYTAKSELTANLLARHFRGIDPGDLVGLHVSSPAETVRWIALDFDAHGEGDNPDANLEMALAVYQETRTCGFEVLLFDSNGAGGYHLWIIFTTPVPQPCGWRLGKWLVRDHSRFGLSKPPESFPKSPRLSGKRCGGWVRLPGKHHTRDHWTRAWDPIRQVWTDGREAILLILATNGKDVDLTRVIPADFNPLHSIDRAARARPVDGRVSRRSVALARLALRHLGDAYFDDYEPWLRVGMALSTLGEAGLAIWHRWSEQSPKYEPHVLEAKWESFAGGTGITLGTLFHMAKEEGWVIPQSRTGGMACRRGSFKIRVSRRNDVNQGSQES